MTIGFVQVYVFLLCPDLVERQTLLAAMQNFKKVRIGKCKQSIMIIIIILRQEKMYIIDIIPYPNSVSVSFLYVVDPFKLLTTSTSIFNDFGRSK